MSHRSGLPVGRLVAEFAVIVFGVLVALGADAAWSARQDRALETETLQRIRADLVRDEGLLGDLRGWVALSGPAARRAPAILESARPLTSSDLAVIYSAALIYVPDRQFATWDDLLASGRTGVVQDPALRAVLNRYYSEFSDVEAVKETLGPDYREAVLSTLPVEYTRAVLAGCTRDQDELVGPNPDGFAAILACPVQPVGGSESHGRQLRAIPGIAGMARLRDYALESVSEGLNRTVIARDEALDAVEAALRSRGVATASAAEG